ncbi:MAG: hypothetical protein ABJA66_11260, partial [Actinomycetota bacterium]
PDNKRLCRPMCGKALPFRLTIHNLRGYASKQWRSHMNMKEFDGKAEPFRTSVGKAQRKSFCRIIFSKNISYF